MWKLRRLLRGLVQLRLRNCDEGQLHRLLCSWWGTQIRLMSNDWLKDQQLCWCLRKLRRSLRGLVQLRLRSCDEGQLDRLLCSWWETQLRLMSND